jgi:biopolymer transport protein ExbD/biopolymer transport protein TolR
MSDINMTPLIDVMLVLLVIFMIAAPLMTSSLKMELPKVAAATSNDGATALSLGITADGHFHVGDQEVTPRASRSPTCCCAPTRACPTAAWPS